MLPYFDIFSVHKNLKGEWKSTGDPTEVALQVFATKLKFGRPTLTADTATSEDAVLRGRPALGQIIEDKSEKPHFLEEKKPPKRFNLKIEFPFSSELKRMTTIYLDQDNEGQAVVLTKGAVGPISSQR